MGKLEVHGQTASCTGGIELHNLKKKSFSLPQAIAGVLAESKKDSDIPTQKALQSFSNMSVDISWLPYCAKSYEISPKVQDYVVSVVPVVTSDVPNRNLQAMSSAELFSFDIRAGRPAFKTFIGKPTFMNHVNKNPLEAKGVNFDSCALSVPKYGLYKILVLSGFDRTKDTELVNSILKKERVAYSMGCWVDMFRCSVCGTDVKNSCMCFDAHGKGGITKNDRLVYQELTGISFFENSVLDKDPADWTAVGNDLLQL